MVSACPAVMLEADMADHCGTPDAVPVPVCERNIFVVVVLPGRTRLEPVFVIRSPTAITIGVGAPAPVEVPRIHLSGADAKLIVPVVVMGPPVRPVPVLISVTVPPPPPSTHCNGPLVPCETSMAPALPAPSLIPVPVLANNSP